MQRFTNIRVYLINAIENARKYVNFDYTCISCQLGICSKLQFKCT